MGIDVVATAKDFETHAEKGYLPENLAKELHNLSDADRLAVAKQIAWDMKQHPDASLPKIDFYDTGDLKAVEVDSKSGESKFVDHYELDKTGKIKAEVKTTQTDNSYEHYTNIEYIERDSNGNAIRKTDSSFTLHGTHFTARSSDEKTAYDPTTGKMRSYDRVHSDGSKLHEEYDSKTGKEKFADETSPKRNVHRSYDSSTGKLQQEEIVNADKSQETIKYNSSGDKVYNEKRYGNNGDKGTRSWTYSPRTAKPIYTKWQDPNGSIEEMNIDENGKYTRI